MPTYNLDVILRDDTTATGTDFFNGSWTLTGGYSTLTISDDDSLGLGDDAPNTETGAPAVVTAVNGDTTHPLVGTPIFARYVRADNGDGDTDSNADAVFLGDPANGVSAFAVAAYPGSGWSMNTGDTFDSNFGVTDHSGGGSWSTEGLPDGVTPDNPPCFTPGSLVRTKNGLFPIQELGEGDLVWTKDNGLQPIGWASAKRLDVDWFKANPDLRPIMIKAGALGAGRPNRDCMVSPGHLVLVGAKGEEVFVPARQLTNRDGVYQVAPCNTAYVHLLFESHQVIEVDGFWSESFQPSFRSLSGLGQERRSEIFRIFPQLEYPTPLKNYTAAREVLRRGAAKDLLASAGARLQ